MSCSPYISSEKCKVLAVGNILDLRSQIPDMKIPVSGDDPGRECRIQVEPISCPLSILQTLLAMQHSYSQAVFKVHENMIQPAPRSLIGEITFSAHIAHQKNYLCTSILVLLAPSPIIQIHDERNEANFPVNLISKKIGGGNIIYSYNILIAREKDFASWINPHTLSMESSTCSNCFFLDLFRKECQSVFTLHPISWKGNPWFYRGVHATGLAYKREASLLLLIRPFASIPCSPGTMPCVDTMIFIRFALSSYLSSMYAGSRLCLFGKMEVSLHQPADGSNTIEETWSLLPSLLLWMIKDRLDFVSNLRLAAVCRNWLSASACYPKGLHCSGDRLPWIMQVRKNSNGRAREFICVSRQEKFIIDLPELCGAVTLCSKQGWLLLRRKKSSGPKIRLPDSVFLFNPFTKAKIEMPEVEDSLRQYFGSFSAIDGNPNFVVLLARGIPRGITVSIAYTGDQLWTQHFYIAQGLVFDGWNGLATIGHHVYCCDLTGRMLIYNIESDVWNVLPRSSVISRCYMVERGGEIIKLHRNALDPSSYYIFRYNDIDVAWERLNNDDVMDTSWFLSDFGNCFSAKENGSKAYILDRQRDASCRYSQCNACVHNLFDGSKQSLFPYPFRTLAVWVDMG